MSKSLQHLFLPAVIPPKKHRILDYATAGAFLTAAGLLWSRHRKPAIAALAHAAFVLAYTPLTDFEGNGRRPISFRRHGTLDRVQAGMASLAPEMLGFTSEKHAWFFRGQALTEDIVIALTKYDSPRTKRILRRVA